MPYCPQCYAEMRESWPRCVLDGQLFRVRRCACGGEIFHDERFCQQCGGAASDAPPARPVPLRPAGYVARLLASGLDVACIGYARFALDHVDRALGIFVADPAPAWTITIGLAWLYFAWFEARGRQTIGDQVLGLSVLTADREPFPLWRTAVRAGLILLAIAALITAACGLSGIHDPLFWSPPWPLAVGLLVASIVPFLPRRGQHGVVLLDAWSGTRVWANLSP